MNVQSVKVAIPQVAGTLKKFRASINVQTIKQIKNVKAEVKKLVNFRV